MHPILASSRRLMIYLAAWIPIAGMLAGVTGTTASVLAPACLLYAFVCLTPWYLCRLRPLEVATAPKLLAMHLVGALAGGALLAGSALGISLIVGLAPANWAPL